MGDDRAAALPKAAQRVSIHDIAALTGLSIATVSRAINNRDRIAPQTRARVLAALETVGYAPSRAATSLSTGRSGLIGLMLGELRDPVALEVMHGALATAVQAAYGVVTYMTTEDHENGAIYADVAARGSVDGVLWLFPDRSDLEFIVRLQARGIPLVLIEPEVAAPGVPTVYADAFDDGYRCTRYLLDLGHRRIALCADALDWGLEGRFLDGYHAALTDADVPIDPHLGIMAGWSFEAGYDAAAAWLRLLDPPTAMCFWCDMAALGGMAAARELGVTIPDDLSVIGYDDTQLTAWVKPALTTLRERRRGLTRVACALLLALIKGEVPPREPVLVKTALIERGSVTELRRPGDGAS